MFVSSLQLILVQLWLNSISQSTANANVDLLNQVLSHSGWKTFQDHEVCYLTNDEHVYETFQIKDVLSNVTVDENNFNEIKKKASLALSSIYFDVLKPLVNNYIDMKVYFDHILDKDIIFQGLERFNEILGLFDPLITCMIEALKFFNEPTPVLDNLRKLKYFHGNVADNYPNFELFKDADVKNVNNELNILGIFNNKYKSFHHRFVAPTPVDRHVQNYIKSTTVVHNDKKKRFNPNVSGIKNKIQEGTKMFCQNFGFKNQITP